MPADDLDRGLIPRMAGIAYGLVLGLLCGSPLGLVLGARGLPLLLFIIVSVSVAIYTVVRITTIVPEGMARAFVHLIWPSGSSTPYEPTYSSVQALAARGDHDGALAAYAEAMRLRPMDAEPRLQAAELLMKSHTPEKAAQYFVQARRLSGNNRARELYVTQRLIDLYWGKLQDHPRARAELRQLITRFPNTREAASAQKLLDALSHELPLNARERGMAGKTGHET